MRTSRMTIALVSASVDPLDESDRGDGPDHTRQLIELAASLEDQGHGVTVHARRTRESARARRSWGAGVSVEHAAAGPARAVPEPELLPWVPQLGQELAARWAHDRPDVVHAHGFTSGLAALVGTRDLGVPVVQTFCGVGASERGSGDDAAAAARRTRLEAAVARSADRVLARCTEEAQALLGLGAARSRIDVVPCGVDVGLFTDAGPARARTSRRRVLTTGPLGAHDGVATVVEALPRLADTELLVAGSPGDPDAAAVEQLRRLQQTAARLGVADRVSVVPAVPREELPSLLRSSDVVVTVPWYDALGAAAVDAMACGRPVVASAVGALLDTVVPDTTGVLVPPRRPDVLADTLGGLLADPLRLQSFGLAAVDRARSRFAWPRVAAETVRCYAAVTTRGAGPDDRLVAAG